MTRGKHGAASAIRRAEAAHEHIDRLTDQLVEAKARARRYEADALRVSALEAELRRLRQQVEDGTSDALERERERHESLVGAFESRMMIVARYFGEYRLTPEELAEMRVAMGWAGATGYVAEKGSRFGYVHPSAVAEADRYTRMARNLLRAMGPEAMEAYLAFAEGYSTNRLDRRDLMRVTSASK